MPTLNEVKEQVIVVHSVGDFTNALQQIATMRMMQVRDKVLRSRPFIEAATAMLREIQTARDSMDQGVLSKAAKKKLEKEQADAKAKGEQIPTAPVNTTGPQRRAVIVLTSNQGLSGRYNIEIYQKVEKLLGQEKDADFFVIGKKGQEYFASGHFKINSFPYEVADNFSIEDLRRLINLFDYYQTITLVYSRFINTATREVVAVSVVSPVLENTEEETKQPGKYIFDPDVDKLIEGVSKKLRAALFQQQIFDSRLAQFAAQMVGMKTASDNATKLLGELQLEYNKQRRKMIDKKISEVFAGSATWQS